jgi:3-phenylpropionate/cinnamic acid dioxygenase small subunit
MGDAADADAAIDAAIRSLLARIAQLADGGDVDDYIGQFTDDAVWAMPANPLMGMEASTRQGHDAILAGVRERRAVGVQGPGTDTRHVITTVSVDVQDATHATARSYYLFFGDTTTTPTLRTMGQYDDVFVKREQGWQLAHRTITLG